jgi:chemotaxis signal transduction protein
MSADLVRGQGSAAALRREFDLAFVEPGHPAASATEDLIALRIAGERHALRLSAIGGLYADRPIVRLPGGPGELLGIAAVRGGLVAVYDLRMLLGYARSEGPRWVALAGEDRSVGLAFEELAGQLRVASRDVMQAGGSAPRGRHVRHVAQAGGGLLPIVDVASIVATIRDLALRTGRPEER